MENVHSFESSSVGEETSSASRAMNTYGNPNLWKSEPFLTGMRHEFIRTAILAIDLMSSSEDTYLMSDSNQKVQKINKNSFFGFGFFTLNFTFQVYNEA